MSALLFCGEPARASLLLTIEQPDQTVTRPDTGSIQVQFSGTITFDPGYTVDGFGFFAPILPATGEQLRGPFSNAQPYVVGGTYTGPFFYLIVPSTATLGRYDMSINGPSYFFASEEIGGVKQEVDINISVDVVAGATAVPEPSTGLLIGAALVAAALGRYAARARAG